MLKRAERIGRDMFAEISKGGMKIATPLFFVKFRKAFPNQSKTRYSVVISKKVEKLAVDRNQSRRRVYAVLGEFDSPVVFNAILFFRTSISKISSADLRMEIKKIIGIVSGRIEKGPFLP